MAGTSVTLLKSQSVSVLVKDEFKMMISLH